MKSSRLMLETIGTNMIVQHRRPAARPTGTGNPRKRDEPEVAAQPGLHVGGQKGAQHDDSPEAEDNAGNGRQ